MTAAAAHDPTPGTSSRPPATPGRTPASSTAGTLPAAHPIAATSSPPRTIAATSASSASAARSTAARAAAVSVAAAERAAMNSASCRADQAGSSISAGPQDDESRVREGTHPHDPTVGIFPAVENPCPCAGPGHGDDYAERT